MSTIKIEIGKDIQIPDGVTSNQVSDGYHTFGELYDHRISLFIALMSMASARGLDCGWSRNHSDGLPCFGGGWVIGWITTPSGRQARYHMEDSRPLLPGLERPVGSPWNGIEETLDALAELARTFAPAPSSTRHPLDVGLEVKSRMIR